MYNQLLLANHEGIRCRVYRRAEGDGDDDGRNRHCNRNGVST
jgi:hypothetical protein